MSEIGLVEHFGMGEAIGIIATLFVILYFSRKQTQTLSVDIETKILNDLDERIHEMTRMGIEQPQLINVISKSETGWVCRNRLCVPHNVHVCPCFSYASEKSIE